MRVLFLTSGTQVPSSRFRVLQWIPHLERRGIRCRVRPCRPDKYQQHLRLGWTTSRWLRRAGRLSDVCLAALARYDVVFLERDLLHEPQAWLEPWLRRAARALVLDLDDAVFLEFPDKFVRIAPLADRILAGNEFLASHARTLNPRTEWWPTCVDLERYPLPAASPPVRAANQPTVIGWTGSSSNLHYLGQVAEALRHVAAQRRIELRVIVDRAEPLTSIDLRGVALRVVPWTEQSEIQELAAFDIGIMPLDDNDWGRGKCGLKAIQYLAASIPAVVSPVGVNCQIVTPEVHGLWAGSTAEWQQALVRLIDAPALRQAWGAAGRQHVAEHYSVAARLPRFIEILHDVAAGRTGGARPAHSE